MLVQQSLGHPIRDWHGTGGGRWSGERGCDSESHADGPDLRGGHGELLRNCPPWRYAALSQLLPSRHGPVVSSGPWG